MGDPPRAIPAATDTEGPVPTMTQPPKPEDEAGGRPGRLLLVGARREVRRLADALQGPPLAGLAVVGFVDGSGRGRQLVVHPGQAPVPILGRLDHLAEVADRARATHLVVAVSRRRAQRLLPQLAGLPLRVHWAGDKVAGLQSLRDRPRWEADRAPIGLRWGRIAKRALDILGSALGLVVLSPLLAAASLAVLISSGRPIFYSQVRVGQGGKPFRIFKFRSMRLDAETATGPIWASNHDDRCTRVGEVLRRTNIDELPQLANVLLGQMSLVGPRPERPSFVETFRVQVPDYEFRHAVPSGMTGWAQVHGWRGRTPLRKRVQYDLDYIRRWNFWLDVKILFMTVQHVAAGKTRWRGLPRRGPRA